MLPPEGPLAHFVDDSADAARPRFRDPLARPAYLAWRRTLAVVLPFVRSVASPSAEVLIGPPRPSDEGAGAVGRLDAAIDAGDQAATAKQKAQIEQALVLLSATVKRSPPGQEQFAQALSDAAYELGEQLLESSPLSPLQTDAARADTEGLLDGIARGAATLVEARLAAGAGDPVASRGFAGEVARRCNGLRQQIARSPLGRIEGRAALVLESGRVGIEVRRMARALGVPARLPFAPRVPTAGGGDDELVTPFTLPAPRTPIDPARAQLGKELFRDQRLSRGGVRSCATCHQPEHGYSDGLAVSASLDPKSPLTRNTPTLLYAPLHAAQLWDGRVLTPESQALGVIHARNEMGLVSGEIEKALAADALLRSRFLAAFPDGLTSANVAAALGAFESQALVPGGSPIDRFARGDELALDTQSRAGLDVFAGPARCSRCHVPPLFGGSRPRDFAVPIFAVVGVPAQPDGKLLDGDLGRGALTHRAADARAFKTPTVRDLDRTAPYFHHGAYKTLAQVIDLYDRGGGKGLGLTVENQDPDVRPLQLSAAEKQALTWFLQVALRDPLAERIVPGQ